MLSRFRFALVLALVTAAVTAPQRAPAAEPFARGKILFLRCASCHDISTTTSPKIGPNLMGVVGRKAGGLPGYAYSSAMKRQTFVWDEPHLDLWLASPSALVPGTAMAFAGLPSQADRKAVIDYLRKPAP